ncbi:MAG: lipoyl(octanoyl) transferase LipB [Thermodesulfobacteriota bacterium]
MAERKPYKNTCAVYQLGLIDYGEAYELQKRLRWEKLEGLVTDTLLLLEHPPTLTIGKSGSMENVLVSTEQLQQKGIRVISIERGGDVTYHGPGQLVGYLIVDLSCRKRDIRLFVRNIEEVLIRTLKDFSITAARDSSHAGVWFKNGEIAAIGLNIQNWITMHGFALNICPNLEHFSYINPCGLPNRRATSMAQILGHAVVPGTVIDRLLAHFSAVFDIAIEICPTVELSRKQNGIAQDSGVLVSR